MSLYAPNSASDRGNWRRKYLNALNIFPMDAHSRPPQSLGSRTPSTKQLTPLSTTASTSGDDVTYSTTKRGWKGFKSKGRKWANWKSTSQSEPNNNKNTSASAPIAIPKTSPEIDDERTHLDPVSDVFGANKFGLDDICEESGDEIESESESSRSPEDMDPLFDMDEDVTSATIPITKPKKQSKRLSSSRHRKVSDGRGMGFSDSFVPPHELNKPGLFSLGVKNEMKRHRYHGVRI